MKQHLDKINFLEVENKKPDSIIVKRNHELSDNKSRHSKEKFEASTLFNLVNKHRKKEFGQERKLKIQLQKNSEDAN